MAQDRIAGIVRALVGVPQERLVIIQKVVNNLNSAAEHGFQFQIALSKFVQEWEPAKGVESRNFELYLHEQQKSSEGMLGYDLERHLEETGLINRTLSLESELVKGWLADPSTYPEEFKDKAVFLWKSRRDSGDGRRVACLHWCAGRVVVFWLWLGYRWYGRGPALLASS